MISALFHIIRELVLLAAAAGIAWWCWDAFKSRTARRDDAARAALTADRQAADVKLMAERIEARLAAIAMRLDEMTARGSGEDRLAADKVRVHALLQSTTDPFLSFEEIERALSGPDTPVADPSSAEADPGQTVGTPLAANRLRRVLIELVRDGAAAQMDRDRYFIASDYETGEDDGETSTPV